MEQKTIQNILDSVPGVFYNGEHFVYAGLKHGEAYVNLRKLLGRAKPLYDLSAELARQLYYASKSRIGKRQLVVAGPLTGGRDMAQYMALTLSWLTNSEVNYVSIGSSKDANGIKTYRINDKTDMASMIKGAAVILVDDLGNEGTTFDGCIRLINEELGGKVIAAGVIANRNNLDRRRFNLLHWRELVRFDMTFHEPEACPFCQKKRPLVTDLGRGNEFAQDHPRMPTKTVLS